LHLYAACDLHKSGGNCPHLQKNQGQS
jgi:hypothetical protein